MIDEDALASVRQYAPGAYFFVSNGYKYCVKPKLADAKTLGLFNQRDAKVPGACFVSITREDLADGHGTLPDIPTLLRMCAHEAKQPRPPGKVLMFNLTLNKLFRNPSARRLTRMPLTNTDRVARRRHTRDARRKKRQKAKRNARRKLTVQ